jgi:hypothetical protein
MQQPCFFKGETLAPFFKGGNMGVAIKIYKNLKG